MGLYITHDYWIGYENNQLLILEKLRDDIFIKRYPIFKTALELLKTLDFTVRIYSIEIMREIALCDISLIISLLFYLKNHYHNYYNAIAF